MNGNRQIPLPFQGHAPDLSDDSFFEAPCNSAALAMVRAGGSDPLLLTGPLSAGKSHLAQIFARRHGGLVVHATDMGPDAVRMARPAAALVLEDGHLWPNLDGAETAAFHLYNQARDRGQRLLVTGQGPLGQWGLSLPDLESRLSATIHISVNNPDETAIRMVLTKLFADRQLAVSAEVVKYAQLNLDRSFAAAADFVSQVAEMNAQENRRITVPLIRSLLKPDQKTKTSQQEP